MEQLKQVLQLQRDGISIREIARRVGISRNSVHKYLSLLNSEEELSDRELADKAYSNDLLALDAERLKQVADHFATAGSELSKTGVTRALLWQEYLDKYLSMDLPSQPGEIYFCIYLRYEIKRS